MVNLNPDVTAGWYVDGMIRYFPGFKVTCGVTTPGMASEYGPDVIMCLPIDFESWDE
jgi:hypothetical protein